jgi:putative FmdB family regulatory protein
MPIYLYVCKDCSEVVEEIRPIGKRDEPSLCKRCGKLAERTMQGQTPQAFVFAPPKHLRYKVERTKHNLATKQAETNAR